MNWLLLFQIFCKFWMMIFTKMKQQITSVTRTLLEIIPKMNTIFTFISVGYLSSSPNISMKFQIWRAFVPTSDDALLLSILNYRKLDYLRHLYWLLKDNFLWWHCAFWWKGSFLRKMSFQIFIISKFTAAATAFHFDMLCDIQIEKSELDLD